jgi:hypothetical protein
LFNATRFRRLINDFILKFSQTLLKSKCLKIKEKATKGKNNKRSKRDQDPTNKGTNNESTSQILLVLPKGKTIVFFIILVGLTGFAQDFYCQLCLSLPLCFSVSVFLCFSLSLCLYLSSPFISLSPLFSLSIYLPTINKFLAAEGAAHFLLDINFYIDRRKLQINSYFTFNPSIDEM